MARGINKVILIGNLGADPEVRYTQAGAAITNIRLATSESWNDRNTGQQQERTEWHRVVFFNKLAEIAGEYLRKGSKVYVEGALRTRKWQDQSGQERYTTEIVANEMQMLDGRTGQGGGMPMDPYEQEANMGYGAPMGGGYGAAPSAPARPMAQPAAPAAPRQAPPPAPSGFDDGFDDDIPF